MRHLLSAAALAALSFLPGQASAATALFSGIPLPPIAADQLVPSVTLDIVTVTGTGPIFLNGAFGLGVNDAVVDSGEIMTVSFARPVIGVSYNIDQTGCTGCGFSDPFGVRLIEAFGIGGVSLGTLTQDSIGTHQISSFLPGNPPITAFMIAPLVGQRVGLGAVTYTEATVVPLPASLPLFLAGLAAFGLVRARKARAG